MVLLGMLYMIDIRKVGRDDEQYYYDQKSDQKVWILCGIEQCQHGY